MSDKKPVELNESIVQQAERLKKEMKLTDQEVTVESKAIVTELESMGYTMEGLKKTAQDLHNLAASAVYASGQVAQESWKDVKAEDRKPVTFSTSFYNSHTLDVTHSPSSQVRNLSSGEVQTVYGMSSVSQTFTSNGGNMKKVRTALREMAAKQFGG